MHDPNDTFAPGIVDEERAFRRGDYDMGWDEGDRDEVDPDPDPTDDPDPDPEQD